MADTRQRLIDGTIETIRRHGLAGTSARSIATTAGLNQALVFYHFGSVHDLLKAACLAAIRDRLPLLEERLSRVHSLPDLLVAGRELHAERQVLAQLMAGAKGNPQLAETTAAALQLWITPIQATLDRLLAAPNNSGQDNSGLAEALCAGFIGLELLAGVDPAAAAAALAALHTLVERQ